jgi:hypothetical protein
MTSVSEALHDIIRERGELRREVAALRASLALEVAARKQWEAWALGAQQNAQELRAKMEKTKRVTT